MKEHTGTMGQLCVDYSRTTQPTGGRRRKREGEMIGSFGAGFGMKGNDKLFNNSSIIVCLAFESKQSFEYKQSG